MLGWGGNEVVPLRKKGRGGGVAEKVLAKLKGDGGTTSFGVVFTLYLKF